MKTNVPALPATTPAPDSPAAAPAPGVCPIFAHAVAFCYAENLRALWLAQANALADGKTGVEIVAILNDAAFQAGERADSMRAAAQKALFPQG